ncbi:MAG: hypothetical protein L3J18_01025 [Candidatus Brocadia sp.]|jgi:ATP synthase I chain.|uniref:ATP synthase I chain n=1 Tax=Candidatus Brocadia fulgida TaxID=380242 RepID=A0A0M2UTZ7_9BACT|nr:MAG: hypothetical protein BROFUL_02849 [Candidatus Brocadia fulgida]UJS20940.1 MAG: hypothetical protein L3J18_01025 [Candidatus Brocadia sp.]
MTDVEEGKDIISLDAGFPDRVLSTSFYLSLITIVGSLSYMSFMGTVSIAVGCGISLLLYKMLWWAVQYAVRHKRSEIKGFFLKVSLVKYGIVGVMLLSVCLFLDVHIVALALGLSMVLIVLVLKIVSRILVNYMNKSIKMSSRNLGNISANVSKKGV